MKRAPANDSALVATFWFATRPPPLTVQGEVSSDRVDISSRVAARVEKLNVNVGERLIGSLRHRNEVVVDHDRPERDHHNDAENDPAGRRHGHSLMRADAGASIAGARRALT